MWCHNALRFLYRIMTPRFQKVYDVKLDFNNSDVNMLEETWDKFKSSAGFLALQYKTSMVTGQTVGSSFAIGVDLPKILGEGKKNIGWKGGNNWWKHERFSIIGGARSGYPQKSTHICLLPWLSRLHIFSSRDAARRAYGGWISGVFSMNFGRTFVHF